MRQSLFTGIVVFALALAPACKKSNKTGGDSAQPATGQTAPPTTEPAEKKPVEPPVAEVKPKPEGYHTVTPALVVKNVDDAVAFYGKVFDAKKLLSMPGPDGKTAHAEIQIGDSRIMIGAEFPGQSSSPETLGGTTGSLLVYVEDVDAVNKRALDAGARQLMPIDDQFWGDRWGMVADPFGHAWQIATHKIDVPPDKMAELAAASMSNQNKKKAKKVEPVGEPAKHWQPAQYTTVTPSLTVKDGVAALAFYEKALGAQVPIKMMMPDGKTLMHGEIKLGDSTVMIAGENPKMGTKSPATLGGTALMLYVYVDDVDAAFKQAIDAKGTVKQAVKDEFWGDRVGIFTDPSGNEWVLATHKQDLTPEQMQENMKKAMSEMSGKPATGK